MSAAHDCLPALRAGSFRRLRCRRLRGFGGFYRRGFFCSGTFCRALIAFDLRVLLGCSRTLVELYSSVSLGGIRLGCILLVFFVGCRSGGVLFLFGLIQFDGAFRLGWGLLAALQYLCLRGSVRSGNAQYRKKNNQLLAHKNLLRLRDHAFSGNGENLNDKAADRKSRGSLTQIFLGVVSKTNSFAGWPHVSLHPFPQPFLVLAGYGTSAVLVLGS
jgi:hypothetical protein